MEVARRPVMLLAAIAIAVPAAILAEGTGTDVDGPERWSPVDALGDARLVGQRLVAGFDGRRPPPALRNRIRSGRIAGVILFEENLGSRSRARRLIRELQSIERPPRLRDPLLVMVDQEGGLVKRLPGPPRYSAEEMGDAGAGVCRRQGAATGDSLNRVGVNIDLAPVLDVARPGSAIERERRSFGRDPDRVSDCANAFAEGLEGDGVTPTAKHFPGLGAAIENTDAAVQRIGLSRSDLRRLDERPYRPFIDAAEGDRLVMISSAIYPTFSGRPAAFSRSLATGELRERLGFDGVSITDALNAVAVSAFGGPARAARAASRAGTDLLLFADLPAAKRAASALRAELRRTGTAGREQFEASVARVLTLRAALAGRSRQAAGRRR